MNKTQAKKTLTDMKSRLQEEIGGLEEALSVSIDDEVEEQTPDLHPGDVGTVTFNREMDLTLHGTARDILNQVDRALAKLEEGTYGICDVCGRRISNDRLEAIPYASLCIDDQRALERREGRRLWQHAGASPFESPPDDGLSDFLDLNTAEEEEAE